MQAGKRVAAKDYRMRFRKKISPLTHRGPHVSLSMICGDGRFTAKGFAQAFYKLRIGREKYYPEFVTIIHGGRPEIEGWLL